MTAKIPYTIGETDFIIEVEYRITSWGAAASYTEPADPIEWEPVSITLLRDWTKSELEEAVERRTKTYEIPVWFQELLDEDGWLDEQVSEYISTHEEYDDGPDPDDYRDRHGSGDD